MPYIQIVGSSVIRPGKLYFDYNTIVYIPHERTDRVCQIWYYFVFVLLRLSNFTISLQALLLFCIVYTDVANYAQFLVNGHSEMRQKRVYI
jgi:hypothetical protein